jgi:hypothetical protein
VEVVNILLGQACVGERKPVIHVPRLTILVECMLQIYISKTINFSSTQS